LNIKLDPEIEKISKRQIETRELEEEREYIAAEEEDTAVFDAVLEHLRSKLISLQATMDLSDSASNESAPN
jgi:hypothetical protein